MKHLERDRKLGLEGLQKHMSQSSAQHCKFVVYDHEYESRDKRKTDKLFFITWSPDGAPGAMNFMNSRQVLREICEGCLDVFAQDAKQLRAHVLSSLDNGQAEEEEELEQGKHGPGWIPMGNTWCIFLYDERSFCVAQAVRNLNSWFNENFCMACGLSESSILLSPAAVLV